MTCSYTLQIDSMCDALHNYGHTQRTGTALYFSLTKLSAT